MKLTVWLKSSLAIVQSLRSTFTMIFATMLLAGCVTRTPGESARLIGPVPQLSSFVWPERDIDPRRADTLPVQGEFIGVHGEGYLFETIASLDRNNPNRRTFAFRSFINRPGLQQFLNQFRMTLMLVERPAARSPRGIIVFLNSLGLNVSGREFALARTLRDRGWLVLAVSPSSRETMVRWEFVLHGGEDANDEIVRNSMNISSLLDDLLAERAYATEAMIEHLIETEPELDGLPIVAVGISAGALMLPGTVARLSERVKGTVMVGGGADLFSILRTSRLVRDRFLVRWLNEPRHMVERAGIQPTERTPTAEEARRLHDLVLAQTRLDPYHAANTLQGIPALVLLASRDRVVPASNGHLLWERLGRPDRWTYAVGHVGLMLWLPLLSDSIADWIDSLEL